MIEGNGVALSGADPVSVENWEKLGDDLYRIQLPVPIHGSYYLIVNGTPQTMGRLSQKPVEFPSVEDLEPGQFRWEKVDEETGSLTYRGDLEGVELVSRANGFTSSGLVRNVKVFNLAARHFLNHGFLIEKDSRGLQFFNIAAVENFGSGFSAKDSSSGWIQQARFSGNGWGISDGDQSDTYYEDCLIENSAFDEVNFPGGRHSLTRCEIKSGPNSSPLQIFPGKTGEDASELIPASLVMRELKVDVTSTTKKQWSIGSNTTVFVDTFSSQQLSPLALTKHPSGRISRDLYRIDPIGRLEDGSPLMTWVGGGSGAPRAGSYRIIHLDKHSPREVASKISPENDWFGLMAPLPTGEFPPQDASTSANNEAAHAIWRWIGLTAPNAVFVPDTAEGISLAEALRKAPPAGVGMVDVFISSAAETGETKTSVLSRETENSRTAKEEMIERLSRTPEEVFVQLAKNFGFQFNGSYIDALALIAKMRVGVETRAVDLARARVNDPLPGNPGNLSGTLLFAEIGEPWATQRVRHVADLAFRADGSPEEAMPMHSEMSDSVFMAGPLLARAGLLTGEAKYFDQCVTHVRFMQNLCLREDGIYRHSPLNEAAWGRGNGFPALGLAMILDSFPKEHPARAELESSFRNHLEALAPHQDPEGMWHQLIDLPDSYAEFSATCMIAYSIARGIDLSLLEPAIWKPRLLSAWTAIKARIGTDGKTLYNVCEGTGKQKSLEDYYRRKAIIGPDSRGGAMALLLSAEMMKWSGEAVR